MGVIVLFVKIFGGSGFLGGHLSRRLLSQGHHVTVLDVKKPRITGAMVKDPTGQSSSWYNASGFVGCDVTDYKQVYYAVDKGDFVVNLAEVPFSDAEPHPHVCVAVNVTGAVNIMQACILNNVTHLVHASTGGVYLKSLLLPVTEDDQLGPNDMYSMSKAWAENALDHYSERLPVTVLRFSNIIGPGKFHGVNRLIDRLFIGERPVIYGDGRSRDDYVYVTDAVQAVELALNKKAQGVFNIGFGKSRGVKEFFDIARMYCDRMNIEPQYIPAGCTDIEFDISKARKELGYSPVYDLEHAVEKTVHEWGQWV